MEHRQQGPVRDGGNRRARGWRLTKASWRLARRDPTLVPLALLALGVLFLVSLASIGLLADLDGSNRGDGAKVLLATIVCSYLWVAIFALVSAALALAASGGFDGEPLTMREALSEAWERRGPILIWALIAAFVGGGIQLLGWTGAGGRLLSLLLGLIWAFLVAYVIPIISLAGADPGEAMSESADLARRRWGEQLSGGVAIFVLTLAAIFCCGVAFGFGLSAVRDDNSALGAVALVMGVVGLAFTFVLSVATTQAFVVALFRFDAGERTLEELESPPPATPIGRSAVVRVTGIIVGLLVAATVLGASLPHDQRNRDADLGFYVPENGWYYATFDSEVKVPLAAGSPVVYEQRQVGIVSQARLEPGRIVVWFRAAPALEEPIEANPKTVGDLNGTPYLRVGPRAGPASPAGPL
jgi:MFS family permease